jgi:glycosyltransferase involved in cell wall biosynthesis
MEDYEFLSSECDIPVGNLTRIHSGAAAVYGEAGAIRDYSAATTLIFSGTWLRRKGTLDLIPAFTSLAERHPYLHLLVLNSGAGQDQVRACFPEHVRNRISCQQSEPEKGVAASLALGDILVLPSLFEGTPLTLIEAMFSGLPVVTTATCGMRDVIEHGRTGLLVPMRSSVDIVAAVERLLGDQALRRQLGQSARKEALERYSWESVAAPVRDVYERLCG